MSQPPKYVPQHSFVSDSATLANFPGQALDVEFQNVKATTDGIETNLALIQRDDGALANGSVSYDQLSASLQLNGIATAVAWHTGTAYIVGAAVTQNQNLYRCAVAHTAGIFATDLAAGKWVFVIGVGNLSGPATSVVGNLPTFSDTVGRTLADSGVPVASLAPLASPTFTGTLTASIGAFTGALTALTVNGNMFTTGTYTLTGGAGKTFTFSNTLTLAGTDGATLNVGAGGTLGSNAFTSTAYAPLASPTFTGAVTVTSAAANALAVGANGVTNPVLQVDASAASVVNGLKVTGAATGGGVAIAAISSGTNETLTINGKGAGGVAVGGTGTGIVALGGSGGGVTISSALTYGGVTLSNSVSGTGSMTLSASPAFTGTPTAPTAAQGTSTTQLATTAFVTASPAFTGTPTAPTAAVDTSTTQLATTAMVLGQAAAVTPGAITNTAAVGTSTRYARADHVHAFENTAWSTYTPTVTAQTGTITTSSATGRYKQIGKTVFLQANVTITTAGTGAANLIITLPLTAASNDYLGVSKEVANTGKNGAAHIPSATPSQAWAIDSSGTTFIANTNRVVYSITYEVP